MVTNDEIRNTFGYIVREMREAKGITREKLAEFFELQPQTISSIETGKNFVSSEVLAKLSNFFEVSPAYFFTQKSRIINSVKSDYKQEIKRLLPLFSQEKCKTIYDVLLVLLNQ